MQITKFSYFFPSHLFTFHSLLQLLLATVKLNRVDQPISIEYKMVHGAPFYANTVKCSSNSSMKTPLCFDHFHLGFDLNRLPGFSMVLKIFRKHSQMLADLLRLSTDLSFL